MVMADLSGKITLVNAETETLFGYTRGELIGQPIESLLPVRFRGTHPAQRAQYFADPASRRTRKDRLVSGRRKDGREFPAEVRINLVETDEGTFALSTIVDFTDLEEAKLAIEESEKRFRSFSDSAPVPMWVTEQDGHCSWLNNAWLNFSGTTLDENVDTGWVNILHPDDRDETVQAYFDAFEQRSPFSLSYRMKRHDGVYRWHTAIAQPRFDRDGCFLGYVGMSIDDHDVRESQAALERSNMELQQFAYVASHDLQEPLRKISAYCQLVREECGDQLGEDGNEYLGVAINGAKRLQTLVRDLLAFSRITTRGKDLVPVDAGDCLQRAVENLELVIAETNATIQIGQLPVVMADAGQMALLFQNLVGNALKYRGEEAPQIEINGREVDDQFEFCVRDNGIGIDPQFFERIFEIFQRLHNRRSYSGTGIGLAICKRVVERFGGKIRVESSPGQESAFYFTLLLARKPEREQTHAERPEHASPAH